MRRSAGLSLVGWLVIVAIIAAGAWFFSPWLLERTSQQSAAREERLAKRAQERKREVERVAKGAVVQSTAPISPDETIKVLAIPYEEFGVVWEKTCIVYTHQTFRVAQLWCDNSGGMSSRTEAD